MATQTRNPTSDLEATGTWTGSAGTRFQAVDDYPDSAGTDLLTHGPTAGHLQFGFSAFTVPAGSTDISVQVLYYDQKSGNPACNIAAELRIGSTPTDHPAASHNPTNGVITQRTDDFTTNPKSAAAWTVDDVNGVGTNGLVGFGVVSTDANPTIDLTSIQLQVTYTEGGPPPPPSGEEPRYRFSPSLHRGLARHARESEAPAQWQGLTGAWVPALGVQGSTLYDQSGHARHGTAAIVDMSLAWVTSPYGPALNYDGGVSSVDTGLPLSTFVSPEEGHALLVVRPTGDPLTETAAYSLPALISDANGYFGIHRGILDGLDRLWAYLWDSFVGEVRVGLPYTVDAWVVVEWILANGQLSIRTNGHTTASVSATSIDALDATLSIGSRGGGQSFAGEIAQAQTHNRAMAHERFATDPMAMFRLRRRLWVLQQDAGTTLAPDPASVSVAVPSATVNLGGVTLTPDPAPVPLAVPNTTLSLTLDLTPDGVAVPIVAPAPAVSLGALSVTPNPVPLPIVPVSPTVLSGAFTLTPDAVATLLGVPGVTLDFSTFLTPDAAIIPLVAPSPSLSLGTVTFTPDPATILITVPSLALSFGLDEAGLFEANLFDDVLFDATTGEQQVTLSPSAVAVPLVTPDPTLSFGPATLTPGPAIVPLVVPAPSVGADALSLTPDAVAALLSVPAVAISSGLDVTPTPASISILTNTPALVFGALALTPDPATILVWAPEVSALSGLILTPDAASIPLVVPDSETLLGTLNLTPGAADISLVAVGPSVSLGPLTISPDALSLALVVLDTGVSIETLDRILTPDPAYTWVLVPFADIVGGDPGTGEGSFYILIRRRRR